MVGEVNGTETRVTGLTPGVLYTFSVSSENDVSSQDNNINDRSDSITIRTREGGLYIHSMSMHARCKKMLQDCFTLAAEPCELYNMGKWVATQSAPPGYKPCVYLAIVWLLLLMFFATQIPKIIVALCNIFLHTTRTTFSDDLSKSIHYSVHVNANGPVQFLAV